MIDFTVQTGVVICKKISDIAMYTIAEFRTDMNLLLDINVKHIIGVI